MIYFASERLWSRTEGIVIFGGITCVKGEKYE